MGPSLRQETRYIEQTVLVYCLRQNFIELVAFGISIFGGCESDAGAGRVINAIIAFQESISVREVHARSGWSSDVADNKINATATPADCSVEGPRPYLRVGDEVVGLRANVETQRLEVVVL